MKTCMGPGLLLKRSETFSCFAELSVNSRSYLEPCQYLNRDDRAMVNLTSLTVTVSKLAAQ